MFGNPAEEWKALTENYRSMSDGQLCELAEAFSDLTPTAQQCLRDELQLRKLGDPLAAGWDHTEARATAASNSTSGEAVVEYTWKTPLCECEGEEQAWQFSEMLRRAKIESWIEGPSQSARFREMDLTNSRILVAADQLEEARAVVAQPVPADIVEASKTDDDDEYELPSCPQCGAADPVLESIEPVNAWKCESCGAEWAERAAEGLESS